MILWIGVMVLTLMGNGIGIDGYAWSQSRKVMVILSG